MVLSDEYCFIDRDIISEVNRLMDQMTNSVDSDGRLRLLSEVESLVTSANLFDHFFDDIISLYRSDDSVAIKRSIIDFLEQACLRNSRYLHRSAALILKALDDPQDLVVKKAIQSATLIFNTLLSSSEPQNAIGNSSRKISDCFKSIILHLVENSENDGVRTQAIKFLETVVVQQSDLYCDYDNEPLLIEAICIFDKLCELLEESYISSINLIVVIQSLLNISSKHPDLFLQKTLYSLATLSQNLPSALARSQCNSVKKALSIHFKMLIKKLDDDRRSEIPYHIYQSIVHS